VDWPCHNFASYTMAFALQLRKNYGKPHQVKRKALGRSALNAIRLVDFAIAGIGVGWPAGPCQPWLSRKAMGSTLGQRNHLPSCRTMGFPTSAKSESKLVVMALMWSANSGTQILVYLPVTYVPVAQVVRCGLRMCVRAPDLHAGHT
jgi:hypothetical protein